MYLGAFYVLTPGSHGLRGWSWISGDPITGVASIGDMVSLLVAIVIDILVGAAVVRRSIDTI